VGELALAQPVSRPAVSQHLKVLQSAQLVSVKPKGNKRLYAIKPEGLEKLRAYLDSFWSDVLSAYSAPRLPNVSMIIKQADQGEKND